MLADSSVKGFAEPDRPSPYWYTPHLSESDEGCFLLFVCGVTKEDVSIVVRSGFSEAVVQTVKRLDLFRGGDLIERHEAHHLAPGHFAHGSLFDHLSVLFLPKYAGDETDGIRQVL